MRIAIVGAGAIGTWLGVRLANSGCEVSVFARDRTLAAIKREGLRLVIGGETQTAKVKASDNAADLGTQDLVVISVKGHALAKVAPAVSTLLNSQTAVLPAMNGVPWWFFHGASGALRGASLQSIDPGGAVSQAIPPSQVLGCVVHAACSTGEPGVAIHKNGNGLIVGEPSGEASARLDSVVGALRKARFDVTASQSIQRDIWYKLWGNMTMNPISALTGATCDLILDDPLVSGLILRAMVEAAEIGEKIGCGIAESGEARMQVTRKLGSFKTSMLQDAEAGRALELDALLAAPREIGRMLGVATPNIDAIHGLARLFAQTRGLNPQ
ncbi:2-dehydropantoate 2-reductase [Steroidobacter sp.]|uniref:2-dehydropantoate 2-reductase n=1 Tax=Steroidobacter sp. TaxID=1978227 RepID=UPI001A3C90A0|nr:2-dehydropantoate 2-reductase [Steroidobacter sp.]MBL8264783.1 2-dehydropantoate 2-reductase [Steroidobacter sp.]